MTRIVSKVSVTGIPGVGACADLEPGCMQKDVASCFVKLFALSPATGAKE